MRAAKIGREMACRRAVARYPQSDEVGLREMMLRRKNRQFPKPSVRIDFFKEDTSSYFGKRSGSSPRSQLRSRIMQLISETRH
jgi:hypothetical protein